MGKGSMKVKHILLGCALAALSANAVADADKTGRGYLGAIYTAVKVKPDDGPNIDLGALGIRGGYYFNKYFSAEGRLGFGVSDDTEGGFKVELDNIIGIYAVGHWPLSDQFQLYGLIGYSRIEITGSDPTGSESDDDGGLSYGVGAEFDMTNNWSLGVEYTSYLQDGEVFGGNKFDATGLGVTLNYIF